MASGPLGWVLLLVALAAAVLLVVADFSQISYRTIGIGACSDRVDPGVCRTYGHDSHSYVLAVVGLAALLMSWGAVVGRARAASVAVAALGVVVLFIALVVDSPKLGDKRGLDVRYNDVSAHTGSAFKLELTGGVLLLLVGGLSLVRAGSDAAPWRPSGRLRGRAGRSRGADGGGDGDVESGREARAKERARRRAARSGARAPEAVAAAGAEPAPPPSSPAASPPPPPTVAPSGPATDAPPPDGYPTDAPPPDGPATDAPPPDHSAAGAPPPDGSATDAPPDLAPDGSPPPAAAASEDSPPAPGLPEEELGPEAYGGHAPEPDPPARA